MALDFSTVFVFKLLTYTTNACITGCRVLRFNLTSSYYICVVSYVQNQKNTYCVILPITFQIKVFLKVFAFLPFAWPFLISAIE